MFTQKLCVFLLTVASCLILPSVPAATHAQIKGDPSIVKRLSIGRGNIFCGAWHPTQPIIAVGTTYGIDILNDKFETQAQIPLLATVAYSLAWSPDGRMLALTYIDAMRARDDYTRSRLAVWDVATLQRILDFKLAPFGEFYPLAWSHDSTQIATVGSEDLNDAQIWDVNQRVQVGLLQGHQQVVRQIVWNGNDTMIATGALDATVKVWSVDSRNIMQTFALKRYIQGVFWNGEQADLLTIVSNLENATFVSSYGIEGAIYFLNSRFYKKQFITQQKQAVNLQLQRSARSFCSLRMPIPTLRPVM